MQSSSRTTTKGGPSFFANFLHSHYERGEFFFLPLFLLNDYKKYSAVHLGRTA